MMFYFGVDYYPEQWPEARWTEDVRLMAEAGFNVVRLAEFAWAKMELQAGLFDFAWLDRVIALLAERGMQIVLGTPTASPPPWLMGGRPELFRVRYDGQRMTYGHRREYCPNQADYHAATQRIVTAMAMHYADHPSVIAWQIDNEFGDRCYCPTCVGAFQAWLRQRYGTLDALNHAWGTVFWSHTYSDWRQIPAPAATGGPPNPGLALDYARFMSDSYVAYQSLQLVILRTRCPHHLVTHNLMGFDYDQIDYFDLARELDLVSLNHYPRSQWNLTAATDPAQTALTLDTVRGLKRRNFWMTEQQAGSGGWDMLSVAPRPGELRLWAYQSVAHGADAIIFFRWRTARAGTEQYWSGLLDHDGRPSRRYAEIKRMGAEIARSGAAIAGSVVRPGVAFLLSYDSRFAFQIQPQHAQFSYTGHFRELYRSFHQRHIAADVVDPMAGLTGYRVVVAPAFHVATPAVAERLAQFVAGGGVLIVTQRTGVKDETNLVVERRPPGLLAELCGVEVEECDALPAGVSNAVGFDAPELTGTADAQVGVLCEVLQPTTATVVATYRRDYYAGRPAITANRWGQGYAIYIGALGQEDLYGPLIEWALRLAALSLPAAAAEGVEIVERWQGPQRLIFVLNHTDQVQKIELPGHFGDLLTGASVAGKALYLDPRDVAVLAEPG
jgi:beta-galactosidase